MSSGTFGESIVVTFAGRNFFLGWAIAVRAYHIIGKTSPTQNPKSCVGFATRRTGLLSVRCR